MPELPEVETVARDLNGVLVGRSIVSGSVRWPKTIAYPTVAEFEREIRGRRIVAVRRRGKYVVLELEDGFLLVHLKMSGRLQVQPSTSPEEGHTHAVFGLDGGQQLRFRDARKFGRIYLVADEAQVTGRLGPEPLAKDFALADFAKLLEGRTGRLKSLLLNQEFLAGLGNIYADESLFAAGLHPLRKANTLTPQEQAKLYEAIRKVLGSAVKGRGTTLNDRGYLDAQGQPGTYQEQVAVYGRTGEGCLICGTAIERIVLGGRSTHFCPRCQHEPAG